MPDEVERKFLVAALPADFGDHPPRRLRQGYVALSDDGVEVRVRDEQDALTLTVKSAGALARTEVELPLSGEQFEALWPLTDGRRIDKRRTRYPLGDLVAEVDVFAGALEGLRVVEVEFADVAAASAFTPPDWFGADVTEDARYKNKRLALDGPVSSPP